MAALTDTERYAAAGIFSLAVAEVEIHQLAAQDARSWSSRKSGLCEHVFRYIKLLTLLQKRSQLGVSDLNSRWFR